MISSDSKYDFELNAKCVPAQIIENLDNLNNPNRLRVRFTAMQTQ